MRSIRRSESASEPVPNEAEENSKDKLVTLGPTKEDGAMQPFRRPIEEAEHGIVVAQEHVLNNEQASVRPGSSLAAANMKQHAVTDHLLKFQKYKEKTNRRNFMKAYMYDSVVKSLLIILDECIKSREQFAVDRTRRFAKELETVRKLQQSEAEAFE